MLFLKYNLQTFRRSVSLSDSVFSRWPMYDVTKSRMGKRSIQSKTDKRVLIPWGFEEYADTVFWFHVVSKQVSLIYYQHL